MSTESRGIFISRGMTVTIPAGGMRITSGDTPSTVRVVVSIDTTFDWLGIAIQHLRDTRRANASLCVAIESGNDTDIGECLRSEFRSGMQASSAAVFAIEAFAESLLDNLVPAKATPLRNKWAGAKTTKAKTVAELFSTVAAFDNSVSTNAADALKWMYSDRNKAVHPTVAMEEPFLHPDLQRGTDWRFVIYHHERVASRVRNVINLIDNVSSKPSPRLGNDWVHFMEAKRKELHDCLRENGVQFTDAISGESFVPAAGANRGENGASTGTTGSRAPTEL